MLRLLRIAALSLVAVLIQTTLLPFLSIRDIAPDLLLIWIAFVAVRDGQFAAILAGFLAGLAVDALAGPDGMMGLASLSLSTAGFAAGLFFNENKVEQTLGGYTFLLVVAAAALLHHTLHFLIFLQGSGVGVWRIVLLYGIPSAAYTVVLALIPMFAFARIYRT
ncbi:MAG: rod shape-determining protein MreD [Bacteroidota bacterium]